MNHIEQIKAVIAYANTEAQTACIHHRPYAHLEEIASRLSAIVEQMGMEPDMGPWVPNYDGRLIQSDDFNHDVTLRVSGDFATDEDRIAYTKWLAAKLNAAPQVPDGMVPAQTVLEWMEEAKEDIQNWACYASEYFREKHNLAADLVKMDMRIAVLERMLIAARAAMGAPDRDAPDWIS